MLVEIYESLRDLCVRSLIDQDFKNKQRFIFH